MTACVFVGPTLALSDAQRLHPAARFLPPVSQGDVYRAVRRFGPKVIGIVDGYFQHRPSVWHKEILWAMSEGVHVYGSSSMGALRATELEAFGMVGSGKIFRAYRERELSPYGLFEGDDEVAVIHGPAQAGYVAVSDAMVNIRFTLNAAHAQGIISQQNRETLAAAAKGLFYPERTYPRVVALARESGLAPSEINAFEAWLPQGKVDQKRLDAIELIEQLGLMDAAALPRKMVEFYFEHTEIWDEALAVMESTSAGDVAVESQPDGDLLDELRLTPDRYWDSKYHAVARELMTERAVEQGLTLDREHLAGAANRFRRANGLLTREDVDAWLASNEMCIADFDVLMQTQASIDELLGTTQSGAETGLCEYLRVTGRYAALAQRAADKRQRLAAASSPSPPAEQLVAWYFEQRLKTAIPDDVARYAARMGFVDREAFVRALQREYEYLRVQS